MPSVHTRQVFGKTRMVQCAVLAQVLQACPLMWLCSEGELWGRGVDHHGSDLTARLAQCWAPNLAAGSDGNSIGKFIKSFHLFYATS